MLRRIKNQLNYLFRTKKKTQVNQIDPKIADLPVTNARAREGKKRVG